MSKERMPSNQGTDCAPFQEEFHRARPLSEAAARHLASCPSCRAQREAVEQLAGQRGAFLLPVSPELRGRIVNRLMPLLPADGASPVPAPGLPGTTLAVVAALVGSLLMGTCLYRWGGSNARPPAVVGAGQGPAVSASGTPVPGFAIASPAAKIASGVRDAVAIPSRPNDE